jgi:hypothetical protein
MMLKKYNVDYQNVASSNYPNTIKLNYNELSEISKKMCVLTTKIYLQLPLCDPKFVIDVIATTKY